MSSGLILPAYLQPVFPMCESLNHRGNAVHIQAENMKFAKQVRKKGRDGRDYLIEKGPVIYEAGAKNVVMDNLRQNALEALFFDTTPDIGKYGGVGSGATSPSDPTLTRLVSENIAGTNRKILTDILGDNIHDSDFEDQVIQENSGSDRWKVVLQYVYESTDADLDGETFAEYAIFDTEACPGSPTGTSGLILLRYVPPSDFEKQDGVKVTVQWTVRS